MRDEYDFSKSKKNPYIKSLKTRTTIRLDDQVIKYFQTLAKKHNIPYQTLINLYLKDCMKLKKEPKVGWKKSS